MYGIRAPQLGVRSSDGSTLRISSEKPGFEGDTRAIGVQPGLVVLASRAVRVALTLVGCKRINMPAVVAAPP